MVVSIPTEFGFYKDTKEEEKGEDMEEEAAALKARLTTQ